MLRISESDLFKASKTSKSLNFFIGNGLFCTGWEVRHKEIRQKAAGSDCNHIKCPSKTKKNMSLPVKLALLG